jgi:predicted metal-dependent HD superfamily phosphohydrolase
MNKVVKKVSEYVTGLLTNNLSSEYKYHNLAHTRQVVDAVDEIGKNSGITDDQLEILHLSAWFHDSGFVMGYKGHESKSIEIADKFLNETDYPSDKTSKVKELIKVTDISKKPVNILEMIIRDADVLHIGKEGFFEKSFSLKNEWETIGIRTFTVEEWIESSFTFLTKTDFYTDYAKSKYEEGRQKNISYLKKLL